MSKANLTKLKAVAAKLQRMAPLPTSGINSRLMQPQQATEGSKPQQTVTKKPYKAAEYEIYKTWRSIPAIMRNKTNAQKLGIQDERILEIIHIGSQVEFAKYFSIRPATLVEWNKKLDQEGSSEWIEYKKFIREMTPTVITSLATRAIQYGDAPRVKLWMQLVEEWREKNETNINQSTVHFDVVDYMKKIEERNAKIRARIAEERKLENE